MSTSGDSKSIDLWDPKKGINLKSFTVHENPVSKVKFSPKRLLASGGIDGMVCVFKFIGKKSSPQILRKPREHPAVIDMMFSPLNENLLSLTDASGMVYIWDTLASEILHEFDDHNGQCTAVSFNPRDNVLTSCGRDGTLALHDLRVPDKEYVTFNFLLSKTPF